MQSRSNKENLKIWDREPSRFVPWQELLRRSAEELRQAPPEVKAAVREHWLELAKRRS